MNSDVFTSQSPGMTNLYFGRPYGHLLHVDHVELGYVDQVNPLGYTTGLGPTLTCRPTYVEYNDSTLHRSCYRLSGSQRRPISWGRRQHGAGVTARAKHFDRTRVRRGDKQHPTSLTQAQAQAYFPTNFLAPDVSLLVRHAELESNRSAGCPR